MNSLCNKLIACYSIGSIFQQLNFFVTFVTVITGNNFISYKTCVLIQLLPIFFSFFSFPLTFFIAIERFLAIFFPIWYKKRNGNYFLIIILFCCFVLGSYVTSVDIITSFGNPNTWGIFFKFRGYEREFIFPGSKSYFQTWREKRKTNKGSRKFFFLFHWIELLMNFFNLLRQSKLDSASFIFQTPPKLRYEFISPGFLASYGHIHPTISLSNIKIISS